MTLDRWDPFRELRQFRGLRTAEDTFDRFWRGTRPDAAASWRIPMDVALDGDNVVAQASLPGVKPEDISVTIDDGVLTISGQTLTETEEGEGTYLMRERRTGSFRRSLRLPESVDADHAESSYEAGVLTVTLPKLETKKAKQLTVQVKDGKALTSK